MSDYEPISLPELIELQIAVGGLSPAQAAVFQEAADKLRAVGELPETWRKGAEYSSKIDDPQGAFWQETHADELEALLKGGAL